jgi:hypothetical protein
VLAACAIAAACATAPQPEPTDAADPATSASTGYRVATMSELMVDVIYPTSDAVFYIDTRTPTTSEEWMTLQSQTLMLAESANLLMRPDRALDDDGWMRDARLLLDAGAAAYRAAKDRDVGELEALSNPLYESCVRCHADYRPDYPRR